MSAGGRPGGEPNRTKRFEKMENIISRFALDGPAVRWEPYGCGHINRTYLVVTRTGRRYILQKINTVAFKDPHALMENVIAITDFLAARTEDPRGSLHLVKTKDDEKYLTEESGTVWRVYDYIEDSLCLQAPEIPGDLYQSAIAFGSFQNQLVDFPAATLHETIRAFHNTPDRYRLFRQALEEDSQGRAVRVRPEIDFALAREEQAGFLLQLQQQGELPQRVTHNDTKLNNVMLDAKTRRALCVIDLDTVMPGLAAYDFGDSIRFGAATAPEDERDLKKMEMSLPAYEIFTRGFLTACPSLTETERATLPMGAKLMTLECGIRFLTDYLQGDRYFSIDREEQNLDRARTQFKLVRDMEKKWDSMRQIVDRLSGA